MPATPARLAFLPYATATRAHWIKKRFGGIPDPNRALRSPVQASIRRSGAVADLGVRCRCGAFAKPPRLASPRASTGQKTVCNSESSSYDNAFCITKRR
jgi:hypothetical protein